jgi:hypothetical protein
MPPLEAGMLVVLTEEGKRHLQWLSTYHTSGGARPGSVFEIFTIDTVQSFSITLLYYCHPIGVGEARLFGWTPEEIRPATVGEALAACTVES